MTTLINENNFFKMVAPYLFKDEQLLPEIIENSIRAKASYVKIETNDNTLTITNDGKVLEDFLNLFVVAQSSYDEDIIKSQKPAGMGVLSILSNSISTTFGSGDKQITIDSNSYFNSSEYRLNIVSKIIKSEEFINGFKITMVLKKTLDNELLMYRLNEDFRYYDIDIIYNNKKIKTKTPVEFLASKNISKGVVLGIPKKALDRCFFANKTDGYVLWHGKRINAPQIQPFTLIVNGETNLVTPVLPNRSDITLSMEDGKKLSESFEKILYNEIQEYINKEKNFNEIKNLLNHLSMEYSLEELNTYFDCRKDDDKNVKYFNEKATMKISFNSNITHDNVEVLQNENLKFVPLNIDKSKAPKWVLDKVEDCFIEIEQSLKAKNASNYSIHRENVFLLVDSIKVNQVEVTGILNSNRTLFFTKEFDYEDFIDSYLDCYKYDDYDNDDDCMEELEEDFNSILSAFDDDICIDMDRKIHNAIKKVVTDNKLSSNDIDEINIKKDEYGNWKLFILSKDKELGEFKAINII